MKKHLVTLFLSAAFVLSSAQANAMRTLKWSELEPPSQAIDLSLLQEENQGILFSLGIFSQRIC